MWIWIEDNKEVSMAPETVEAFDVMFSTFCTQKPPPTLQQVKERYEKRQEEHQEQLKLFKLDLQHVRSQSLSRKRVRDGKSQHTGVNV